MKKGQVSLEYLALVAAVLIISSVVVLLTTGSVASNTEEVSMLSCQSAARECALLKRADASIVCDFCDEDCIDPAGEEVSDYAINCCKIGNSDAIYEGSVETCVYVPPVVTPACTPGYAYENCSIVGYDSDCVSVSCPVDICVYDTATFEDDDCNSATGTCQSGVCVEKSESCGNGEIEGSEECDDGNSISWDGCENDCTDSLIVILKNFEVSEAYGYPDNARVVFVSGDYAYVSEQFTGLRVFDVSDKSNPLEVGFFDYYFDMGDIFVQGDYAYITSMEAGGGLVIVDVSNKSDLLVVYDYNLPSTSVFVSGDYAYLGGSYGLKVIDVSDKSNPSVVGSYLTSDYVSNIFVSGDYVYASTIWGTENSLYIFDISNPTSLNEVGSHISSVNGIFVEGDYAYLAEGYSGLSIVDVSDKSNLTEIGYYNTPDVAMSVFVFGDYAYVSNRFSGLLVFDVSDKSDPKEFTNWLENSRDIFVDFPYIYSASGSSGFYIGEIV